MRTGRAFLRDGLPCLLEDAGSQLSSRMRAVLNRFWLHWQHLEQQINDVSKELQVIAKSREICSRLMTVPAIGPLAATAMIAAVGKGNHFEGLATWLPD